MTSLAGARRTALSYSRFLAAGNPSDIQVNPDIQINPNVESDPDPELLATLLARTRGLPGVTRTASYGAFLAAPLTPDGKADLSYVEGEAVGSIDGLYFDQDQFAPTSGRLPDPTRPTRSPWASSWPGHTAFGSASGSASGCGTPTEDAFFDTNPDPNDRLDVTVVGIGLRTE